MCLLNHLSAATSRLGRTVRPRAFAVFRLSTASNLWAPALEAPLANRVRGRQEQQIFSARDVQKGDARPGGYVTTGGHGGVT